MFNCSFSNPIPCRVNADGEYRCCPLSASCSEWGCVLQEEPDDVFVSTAALLWTNVAIFSVFAFTVLWHFASSTLYYWMRRRRMQKRVEKSRGRVSVNAEEMAAVPQRGVFGGSRADSSKLHSVAELNGMCCGCGGVADVVLLPCKHAVCCYSCSANASYCPFCKLLCEGKQRLFAV